MRNTIAAEADARWCIAGIEQQQQMLSGDCARTARSRRPAPAQLLREHEHQQRAHHEHRHRRAPGRHAASDAIECAARAHRRKQPAGRPMSSASSARGHDQLEGARQAQRDLARRPDSRRSANGRDRRAADRRHAVDTASRIGRSRPSCVAQLRDRGRIGRDPALGKQHFGRIARHHLDRQKHDGRDDQTRISATAIRYAASARRSISAHPIDVSSSVIPEAKVSAPGRLWNPSTFFFMA